MATKQQLMQQLIRQYKAETGKKEVDMHDVATWAVAHGFKAPPPIDPIDRLAKDFSQAAREEIRHDKDTGRPYRANHAVPITQKGQTSFWWVDIDERPPRKHMLKSLMQRREQMIGDGLQLTLDADHWNSINPVEEPIVVPMDFTDDIEWRKNAPDDGKKAG
jgi:hypothetical protein